MARTTRGEEEDESEDLMILVLIDGVHGREMLLSYSFKFELIGLVRKLTK